HAVEILAGEVDAVALERRHLDRIRLAVSVTERDVEVALVMGDPGLGGLARRLAELGPVRRERDRCDRLPGGLVGDAVELDRPGEPGDREKLGGPGTRV